MIVKYTKYTKIGETVARLNARIATLEAALAESEERWIQEREAWIRQKAECVTLGEKLAEAREDSKRLTWAWEYPEAFITARRTTPPDLTGRQQIDAYRGKP